MSIVEWMGIGPCVTLQHVAIVNKVETVGRGLHSSTCLLTLSHF
jgi:hypothetical protein